MINNTFYSQFHSQFEPQFQTVIQQLYTDSSDTSFDPDLISTFLNPIIPYVQTGKRIRPFLIAVGADRIDQKVIDAGIAFELLHTFTLIHDDIMDGATMRRNVPTVHVDFDNQGFNGKAGAMLVGDFLFARCNEYMSEHVPELMPLFSKMQRFLCIGQFYEMVHWGKNIEEAVSQNIARFKSAQYSFMYPLQFGLHIAGRNIHLLDDYADCAGLAFQLRDDWIDISEEMESGKDKQLDSENSVPNQAQFIMQKHNGDKLKSKNDINKLLLGYKKHGLQILENSTLSEQQSNSLSSLLAFSTSIQ